MHYLSLPGGGKIPCIGYGCYNAFGEELTGAVRAALEAGYRYIDSAEFYKNEPDVGRALATAPAERSELFVLSKAWPTSFEDLDASCTRTLAALQTDYLDAYLLHWPGTKEDRRLAAYEQLLSLVERGLVRYPGVSNFTVSQLEQLKETFGSYPAIHEIECHPSYQQRDMIDWCLARGIRIISYQPINRGADLCAPAVTRLAEEKGRTPAQIVLRWHVQREHLPIPKSVTPERIRENLALFDFSLSEAELAELDALDTGVPCGQNPLSFPPGC